MDKSIPSMAEAISQMAEFCGFDAHYDIQGDDEVYRITYRQLLPADVREALDRIDFEIETTCDRAEVVAGGRVISSSNAPAYPLRRNGELVTPSQDEQRLIAMWGREKFDRFVAEGGAPGILSMVWRRQDEQYKEWLAAGSKSARGSFPVAG